MAAKPNSRRRRLNVVAAVEATRLGLIDRARCGDEAAFTALLEELADPAYRLALAMLRDRSAAEDAVQEAALKAWRKIGTLREGTTTARPWFLTIVANQCRSMLRGRWFRVQLVEHTPGVAEGFESRVLNASELQRLMTRLNHQQRLALVLYFYLDLPLEEVARVLGVQPAAAKSRIYRAARALRPGLVESEVLA
jgi:RNA polymerase sigma-70 factor (ECF subfamily)